MVRIKQLRENLKPLVKPTLIVFNIILVGMIAILRANFSYMDDLARTAEGYKGWGNFSRYLSNFLAIFLFGNSTLADISPWPQIVAALLMAISGISLLYIIYGRKKFHWWELVVVAILALNPYFLECLSYKFDAPFIALSVLAMIIPLVARHAKTWLYALVVLFGTLTTCMTYQAALGILPMLTILLAARMWEQNKTWKEISKFIGSTALGYMVALIIFKVFIMQMVDAYVVTSLPALKDLIPHTLGNLHQYYELVKSDFAPTWLLCSALIVVGFTITMTINAKRPKWLSAIIALATTLFLGISCFGIYAIMERPLFEPRAMFGITAMLCLMAIVLVEKKTINNQWLRYAWSGAVTISLVLVYLFGTFSFTYGNALALQKDYTDFRIEAVLNDLDSIVKPDNIIEVSGTIGLSPALETATSLYPILERLVPVEFESGYWGTYKLLHYYDLREFAGDVYQTPNPEEYTLIKTGNYHNLRQQDNKILIELK